MNAPATSWSFSKLGDFNTCKRMFEIKHIQRVPEPERPLPPGKTEHANDRGTRVHTSCELFINGTEPDLVPEADKHFGVHIGFLREMYRDGLVSLEGEWGMDRDWATTGWNGKWFLTDVPAKGTKVATVKALPERGKTDEVVKFNGNFWIWTPSWLRLKLDAMVMHDKRTATVIDFKTGKKFGNEIKHAQQLQLYQLITFLRYPELETVYAELWYLDQNEITSQRYTRDQGMRFKATFEKQGNAVTTTTVFPPNPNAFSCRWCPYKPVELGGTGHCLVGVK